MSSNSTRRALRRSDTAASYGILAAGIVHTGFTPVFKPSGGEESLWFAGSGLALCFLGALNLLRLSPDSSTASRRWCGLANIASAVFLALVGRELRKPHIYAVLACVGWTGMCSFVASVEPRIE